MHWKKQWSAKTYTNDKNRNTKIVSIVQSVLLYPILSTIYQLLKIQILYWVCFIYVCCAFSFVYEHNYLGRKNLVGRYRFLESKNKILLYISPRMIVLHFGHWLRGLQFPLLLPMSLVTQDLVNKSGVNFRTICWSRA